MNHEETWQRIHDIQRRMADEPAFRVEQQMRFVSRMTMITSRNWTELKRAINAIADHRLRPTYETGAEDPEDDALLEVTRRLDNFLASTISRVERCDGSAKLLADIDASLKGEVRTRIRSLPDERPVYALAEHLRHTSIHVSYHGIQSEVDLNTFTARAWLMRRPATAGRGVTAKLAARINAFPSELEIQAFSKQFNDVTDEFISWYHARLRTMYDDCKTPFEALRDELISLLPPDYVAAKGYGPKEG